MRQLVTGIHHVIAIASSLQMNIDFYTGIFGVRLVKKTVNFDVPETYHFFYGDEVGNPRSILTFFPYNGLIKGSHGTGFLNTTTFSLPFDSLDYWNSRLKKFKVNTKDPQKRFQNEVVV
ncbi:MAG: VOC family protein [Chryseolinea sp.]